MEGELRITVRDPAQKPVRATVQLSGRNPQFHAEVQAGSDGQARLSRLPMGVYRLSVSQRGFEPFEDTVEIRSAIAQTREISLNVSALATQVTVTEAAPLLDPSQPSQIIHAGREQLEHSMGTTLGRSTIDVVTTMPGWLLEANAVLHPRGSEYDTQYVVDGMPLYDNRSIAFAPAFENEEFESVNVLTAGIPAEYGRRLGGVIALDTRRTGTPGQTTDVSFQSGTYANNSGSVRHQIRTDKTAIALGGHAGITDRYLDPPSLENFTNHASAEGFNARLEHDLTSRDRIALYLRSNRTNFMVPNDLEQEEAGQRQDRRASETAGQVHYQHTFSASALGSIRGMVRDLTAKLWSNPLATPVHVDQDRGFREGAITGSLTLEGEHHTFKLGGDFRTSNIRERFQLAELDEYPELDIDFNAKRRSTESSVFVQDQFRFRNLAISAGLRFDQYKLLISDHAFSPRVALSYYIPSADLMLRASYDRIFQSPPLENLLFSSAAAGLDINDVEDAIPVPASRANFFEVGLRKPMFNTLRLDVSHYWRTFRNYQDDDVFLNTGVSFPITFDTARIQGTEVRLEMPRWKQLSSWISYSNMRGTATSPVTGGLFIEGGEADELRDVVERFAISQDQRNTVAARVQYEPHRRLWFASEVRYGSGLPVELEDDDDGDDDDDDDDDEEEHEQQIPPEILARVNFERGRIRPNFSLNFSAGARVWQQDHRFATLQFDVRNVTDRLNVINFSGLFSGTALAPGRQFTVQMRLRF
jgi:hypothetical protein